MINNLFGNMDFSKTKEYFRNIQVDVFGFTLEFDDLLLIALLIFLLYQKNDDYILYIILILLIIG